MGSKRKRESYSAESVDYTTVEMDTFEFTWEIPRISELRLDNVSRITSPQFIGGPKTNHVWNVRAKVSGVERDDEEIPYFGARLILSNSDPSFANVQHPNLVASKKTVPVSFQFCLLHPDNTPWRIAPKSYMRFTCTEKRSKLFNIIPMDELLHYSKGLIVNDVLKVRCQIWIEGTCKHTLCPGGILSKGTSCVMHGTHKISTDLKTGLESESFSDVSLVTSTKTFHAHKFMLAARSNVFHAMFASTMLESTQNSVEIPDFDESVVQAMLEFIYSGETSALGEKAPELLIIAEKYDVSDLKAECEDALGSNLEIETAAETLIFAHMHNALRLKTKLFYFINRNKEKFNQTPGYKLLQEAHPSLQMELYFSRKQF